jgi:hypothetical protein
MARCPGDDSFWRSALSSPDQSKIERQKEEGHQPLKNMTPADVYFGRGQEILNELGRIKRQTLELQRLLRSKIAA